MNLGLSPEQLALKLNHRARVSGRTIRRIEEGNRPTVRTMFSLAQFFDLEVTDLWSL